MKSTMSQAAAAAAAQQQAVVQAQQAAQQQAAVAAQQQQLQQYTAATLVIRCPLSAVYWLFIFKCFKLQCMAIFFLVLFDAQAFLF